MLGNKLRYLLVIAVLAVFAFLYNEYITFQIFFVVLIFPVVLYILLRISGSGLSVNIHALGKNTVAKGEKIPLIIEVTNKSIFPVIQVNIKLAYYNNYSKNIHYEKLSFPVDGKSVQSVSSNISSEHCGRLVIVVEQMHCYDFLKIWNIKKKTDAKLKISVVPECFPVFSGELRKNAYVSSENDIYSKTRGGDDPSEVFQIRDYREGDKIHRIHWKLSSKKDSYMVKEFSEPINCSILILLDFCFQGDNREILSYMDAVLEVVVSISVEILLQGLILYLSWYDVEGRNCIRYKITEEGDLFTAIDALLSVTPYTENVLINTMYKNIYPAEQYSHIYYIGARADAETIDGLERFNKTAYRNIIYINYLEKAPMDGNIKSALEAGAMITNEIDIVRSKEGIGGLIL